MVRASKIAAIGVVALAVAWGGRAIVATEASVSYPLTLDYHCLNVTLNLETGHWHSDEHIPTVWLNRPIDGTFVAHGDRAEFVTPDRAVPFTRFEHLHKLEGCSIP